MSEAVATSITVNDPRQAVVDLSCSLERLAVLLSRSNNILHEDVVGSEDSGSKRLRDQVYDAWLLNVIAEEQARSLGHIASEIEVALLCALPASPADWQNRLRSWIG